MLACIVGTGKTPEDAQRSVLEQFNNMGLNPTAIIRIETIPSTLGIWPIRIRKYTTTLWYNTMSDLPKFTHDAISPTKRYIGT